MYDELKPLMLWIGSTLIGLFKGITMDTLVGIVQIFAFMLTICYTVWKWRRDKKKDKITKGG